MIFICFVKVLHIGVEVTEPSTIRYTSGSNWTEIGDGVNTRQHVMATYKIVDKKVYEDKRNTK